MSELMDKLDTWYSVYLCDYGWTDKVKKELISRIRELVPKEKKCICSKENLWKCDCGANPYNQCRADMLKRLEESSMIHQLNKKGQCPVCKIKPLVYKRNSKYFCHRCDRAYELSSGIQIENWAYEIDYVEKTERRTRKI